MKKNTVLALTAAALAVVTLTAVVGLLGVSKVSALLNNGGVPTVIENLAKKFNVSTSEVQQVFDDTKTQQENARLDQLVTDGKITAAQKQLILDKRTEIESKIADINNKQMTTTERSDAYKALRDDLKSWASNNGIDESYILNGKMGKSSMMVAGFDGRMGGAMR